MAETAFKPSYWSRAFDLKSMPGFTTMAMICFFLLYVPLVPLVVYSFNSGSSIALWEGFSWRWYESAWANTRVQEATILSLIVASSASLIATTAATMAALARSFFIGNPFMTWPPDRTPRGRVDTFPAHPYVPSWVQHRGLGRLAAVDRPPRWVEQPGWPTR